MSFVYQYLFPSYTLGVSWNSAVTCKGWVQSEQSTFAFRGSRSWSRCNIIL